MTDFGRRTGEMLKSTYDADEDGTVDNSEKLEGNTLAQVQDHTPKTHTHTESQISDLDHDALKVKGVIINDAAIADQKVLAYDSGTQRIIYIDQAPSGAILDNIQTVEITLTHSNNYGDFTITEVDLDKTFLIYAGHEGGPVSAQDNLVRLTLINSTTVQAYRAHYEYETVVRCFVLEFSSGINSIQRGNIILDDATVDVDISAVDLDKSFISLLGTTVDLTIYTDAFCTIKFKDTDTITIERQTGSVRMYISWEVVEFS